MRNRIGKLRAVRKLLCILGLLSLSGFFACQNKPDEDLLGALLSGQANLLFSTYSVHGTNGAALESGLVSTIHASKKTLYCVFEDVALPGVWDALHLAYLRGVDVRVGLDEDNKDGPGYGMLAQYMDTTGSFPRLQVGNSGDGEVYMNICVADKTRVWASSAAPTPMDMYAETAFSLYFQSEEDGLVEKFNVVLDLTTHGSFGSSKQRLNRRNHWLLGTEDVGIYFAPEEDPLEGFMTPRVRFASDSIIMYSSEFFSNQLDSNDVREQKDLAYEIRYAAASAKGVLVPWYAFFSDEPPYQASKNSWNYLYDNGVDSRITGGGPPGGGMSFLVMDGQKGSRMSFLSSHPYSKRTDSSHDGFTFVFEGVRFASELTALFDTLRASSYSKPAATGLDITAANGREIVISEINWMGGYKNDSSSSSGEYVEFFNTQANPINVSGWKFICNNGSDTTIFTFPSYTVISPGEYFLVSRNTGKFVERAHLFMSTWTTMPDDSQACRLEDANATVIDTAGAAPRTFASLSDYFGLDDTTNKINRSMERVDLYASGTSITNWHTNSHTSWNQNYNISPNHIQRTFGTPGYANSRNTASGSVPQSVVNLNAGDILITEVHFDVDTFSGFEGGGGTLCTEADDEFIEILNNTNQTVDMGGATLQYGTSSGNFNIDYTFPNGFELAAGARVVVVARDAGCYNSTSLAGVNALFDTASWSLSGTGATFALVKNAVDLPDGQTGPAINAGTTAGVLDYVGTQTGAVVYETARAPDCTDQSLIRTNPTTDTDDNSADFSCGTANGTPGH